MRGFLAPGLRQMPNDSQKRFAALTRHRRTKLAKTANTTLVKADQWARGDVIAAEVATALEHALTALHQKLSKKK